MIRGPHVLDDIFTPGTPGDFERTVSTVPTPPTDFNVQKTGTNPEQVKILIGDRHYVARRAPNLYYKVYFTPLLVSGSTDMSDPSVRQGIVAAGQIVCQVAGQGDGNTLTSYDSQFAGKQGYFSCVGTNILNDESVCLHVVPSPWNGSPYVPPGPPGTGTVTQINQGSGIALTPNPIVTTGSVALGTLTGDWNAGAHMITAAGFSGPLTGNVTGNCSGTSASFTGNLTGDVTSAGMATTVVKINGTSLAALATGILKNTTGTGVPSIAIAADFPTLNQSTTGNALTATTATNLAGGAANQIPYQSGAGATTFGAGLTWDGSTHYVGGTTKFGATSATDYPTGSFHFSMDSSWIVLTNTYNDSSGAQMILRSKGTAGSGVTASGDWICFLGVKGYYTGAWEGLTVAAMYAVATENHTSAAQGTKWCWDVTANGAIGAARVLGMTLDSVYLTAAHSIALGASSTGAETFRFYRGATLIGQFYTGGSGSNFFIEAAAADANLIFQTGGANNRFYIKSTGEVGIATTSPAGLLSLGGDANGGQASLSVATELLTVAAAATSDTVANLLPAGARVESVSCRVTTVIPSATSFTLSSATDGIVFTGAVLVAAGSTDAGVTHWVNPGRIVSSAAQKIRLTITGTTPANNTGRVRITVYYWLTTPPTS